MSAVEKYRRRESEARGFRARTEAQGFPVCIERRTSPVKALERLAAEKGGQERQAGVLGFETPILEQRDHHLVLARFEPKMCESDSGLRADLRLVDEWFKQPGGDIAQATELCSPGRRIVQA